MKVLAPLSGVVVPLDAVPDPVFARRMVGDGLAIEPTTSEVLAPIEGTVTQLHAAHHAIAVTGADGVEVLVHVGLDTVSLEGRGFTPLVERGARVQRGQPLLRFDPEVVAREARSLVTAVVVTSGQRLAPGCAAGDLVEAGRTALLLAEVGPAPAAEMPASEAGSVVVSKPVAIPNAAGLHARPAAVLATEAKRFASRVRLLRGADEANAKSIVAIMGLSTKRGDEVRISAAGADASDAVAALERIIADGCGESRGDVPAPVPLPLAPRAVAHGELVGVPASPGVAMGPAFRYRRSQISVPERGGTEAEERARFEAGVREAARQIEVLKLHAQERARAQIMEVHLALLDDPDLVEPTEIALARGKSAAFAWQQAYQSHASRLEHLDNPLLRERAADVRDVGLRLLALLAGVAPADLAVPEGAVLVADELTPSEMAIFDRVRLAGLATTTGGSTSHVAILARAKGLPAVCGVEEGLLDLRDGVPVVVDGTQGFVRVDPDQDVVARARSRIARQAAQRTAAQAAATREGRTRDGHRVEVAANIRNVQDAREAMLAGAEGIGLLRSEFLFLGDRTEAPAEDEQAAIYRSIAQTVGKDRRLVIRTLDVGGDKPLSYLPLPREANPFLGVRGIRVSLEHPALFLTQLRAILRAAPAGDVHVMFPMIATLEELREAKALLAEAQRVVPHAVKVGIMVEVPSAAIIAEVLAREVDFLSIGTNDLTQYTLAMDRGHAQLAKQADALHPAVLRMIALTIEGAHEHGKWVGVCGGLASDPLAVPVLTGLGVDELSVGISNVGEVKAALSGWTFDECSELASQALRLRTAADVREFLVKNIERPEQDEELVAAGRVTP
jgi:phosphocarrier protein FPr/phosphocarrier protein